MKQFLNLTIACGLLTISHPLFADSSEDGKGTLSWATNGAAVFTTVGTSNPAIYTGPPVRKFQFFFPNSLNHLLWTNFLAHTNHKDMLIWSTRTHSPDWPAHPPVVTWNTNSLIWGLKGITALSPCWEVESGIGQVPVTALTRRHVYVRGHGMGPDGFNENFAKKKIWFVTTNNMVVEATVLRNVVRTMGVSKRDYTILLLTRDLPPGIEPIRVVSGTDTVRKYPDILNIPRPLFKTEQTGHVSTSIDPLTVNTWKAGDSGSPDMLPMPGELVFVNGRSTSGASPEMQADMDQLSKSARLDPKKYQLRWLDLSAYPQFDAKFGTW
jgi:hypothetical protein